MQFMTDNASEAEFLRAELLLEDPELLANVVALIVEFRFRMQGAREQRGSRIGSQKIAARPRVP